jgi:aminoglycoside phosphotransferase (APT) family kinase protein
VIPAGEPQECILRPLSLTRESRLQTFHMKTDLAIPDLRLCSLRQEAEQQLHSRSAEVARLLSAIGIQGKARALAAGTFHLIYRVTLPDGRSAILRIPVSNLFVRDYGLTLERSVKAWLKESALDDLIPETIDLGFAADGAPGDFVILSEAPGEVLRDLGDQVLDDQPQYLTEIGRSLRSVHDTAATGAGLLEFNDNEAAGAARGVHSTWAEYLFLNLERHVTMCIALGVVDERSADKINRLFESMKPSLSHRPSRLLHGDPGTHNICVNTRTLAVTCILDWEDAMAGDPLFDVAMFSTFQPARRMPAFLAGYGLADPSGDEQRLLALYFLRIALSKTVHRSRFGIADRPDRAPAHDRIDRGIRDLEKLM